MTDPTAAVPVAMSGDGLAERDGIEAKAIVLEQLGRALEVIGQHDPARIVTLGGECSVSVAPFSYRAFTVAEFIPRQVISLQQLLTGFPLISGR